MNSISAGFSFSCERWKQRTWVLVEAMKISLVALCLHALNSLCLDPSLSPASPLLTHCFIVIGNPLYEEFFFRGLLLSGIYVLQKGWNRFVLKRELTENEEKIQRLFRIHLAALIFAMAHFVDAVHFSSPKKAIVFISLWSYFAGVLYGHLTEKYHTLSLSLLAHGVHNFLTRKFVSTSLLIAAVVNKLFFFMFI